MKTTTALLMSVLLLSGGKKDIFSTKSIETRMVKVEASLYANKYETTNAEYREFLTWVKQNQANKLDDYDVKHEGWDGFYKAENRKSYATAQYFDNYPVVNITHASALAFCDWMTDRYNNSTDRKKKFKKVKFRLPTRQEWLNMAINGRPHHMKYPWGGPYMRNRQGKYLANFKKFGNHAIKMDINNPEKVEIDGIVELDGEGTSLNGVVMITAKVDSYMATGAGLHNLAGNAAEMLAEKGHTKGGSWGSSGYYLQIDAEDEFEGFTYSPYVGFRYVMEVIEE